MLLQDLSPEILLQIADYVGQTNWGYRQGTTDLLHLGRCSRQFNIFTTPLLYRTVATGAGIAMLLHRLITQRPTDVSTSVKTFISTESFTPDGDGSEVLSMAAFPEEDLLMCDAMIREICTSEERAASWINEVRAGRWEDLLALTLALLPNLEQIQMQDYMPWYTSPPEALSTNYVLSRAARLQREGRLGDRGSMAKLHSVTITYADTEGGFGIQNVIAFLKLQSVRKVELHMLSENEFDAGSSKFFTEDLTMTYSCIEGNCLVRLLRCFPNLKRFSYENGGCMVGNDDFLPQKIGEAIAHVKPCLEELEVTDMERVDVFGDVERLPLGPLIEFKTLKKLITHSEFLLGDPEAVPEDDGTKKEWSLVEVLPKSLQSLELEECQTKELGYLRDLISGKEEVSPLLEFVNFKYKYGHKPDMNEINILAKDCLAVGIHFVVSKSGF